MCGNMVKCNNCGTSIEESDNFCMNCGNKIEKNNENDILPLVTLIKCHNCKNRYWMTGNTVVFVDMTQINQKEHH